MTNDLLIIELMAPTIAALVLLIFKNKSISAFISLISVCLSFAASLILLLNVIDGGIISIDLVNEWIVLPGLKPIGVTFTLDFLSTLVSLLVCGLATLILTYSISYVNADSDYHDTRRYWFLILIFIASMLVVINSDNFILMFVGWEGMSLSSYLLIGYYYGDESKYWIGGPLNKAPMYKPSQCSYITFLIVGSADTFMLLGIVMLMVLTGSPYYEDLYVIKELLIEGIPDWAVVLSFILFLLGPIAKSAQFPLHLWLPYAMAGPTPVSALLHSATMVKAGVYIILRLLPYLIEISHVSSVFTLIFYLLVVSGSVSMVIAAVNAGRSIELKRVLAYSTISQIGYMFILLGVAGFAEIPLVAGAATLYHLINHALFKSALFLTAGILIHTTGTKYLNEMGLHIKEFKSVFIVTLISSLSLIGVPPLMGFWSKEFIIETVIGAGHYILFLITLLCSFLTAFYATRMLVIVFGGQSDAHYGHHNVDRLMYYPPLILTSATFIAGIVGLDIKGNLLRMITLIEELEHKHLEPSFIVASLAVIFAGVLLAVYVNVSYIPYSSMFDRSFVKLRKIYSLRKLLIILKEYKNRFNYRKMFNYFIVLSRCVNWLVHRERHYLNFGLVTVVIRNFFTTANYLLDLTVMVIGRNSFKYLKKLFKAVGYADMDTFLSVYVVTLSILLTGMLILLFR
ncbi:MAG: NADH-quinone oxidoreductase subunit L [Sulfolobales archaeon]|nr:NADH-quinone oxidoreductase subunit L [Sulfolobales archaeon]MCX8186126.1 NADH-quinone oxidoreductase subunit L [Sulfolobales archaeon]MDW7969421.1 NADH-quinone oxidoreductase subunit L [Sulfolobales archaeon]